MPWGQASLAPWELGICEIDDLAGENAPCCEDVSSLRPWSVAELYIAYMYARRGALRPLPRAVLAR